MEEERIRGILWDNLVSAYLDYVVQFGEEEANRILKDVKLPMLQE